jgi:hypothetical protein
MGMKLPSVRRPSPALVVATIALFVALSGSAVALQGQNTVDSGDIINGEVGSKDLNNGGVKSKDVKDENLQSADVKNEALTSADVSDESLGSADLGPASVHASELALIDEVPDPTPFDFGNQDEGNNDYVYGTSIATCPADTTVIGGGGEFLGAATGGAGADELQAIHESRRSGNGWLAIAASDVDNQDFRAFAYCLSD